MLTFFSGLVEFSANNFHIFSYGLAFLFALLETMVVVGFFVPGSTAILFLGAFSAMGYLDIKLLFLFAVVGAVVGDNFNYFVGRKYGSRYFENGFWILTKSRFLKAKKFFNKHGVKSVFLGRFIPSIKEVVPLIAGTLKMDKKKFFLWNFLGAVGWGAEWLFLGYIFGSSVGLAKKLAFKISLFAGFFLIVLIFFSVTVGIYLKYKTNDYK